MRKAVTGGVLALALAGASLSAMTLDEFRALADNRIAVRTSFGVRSARALDVQRVTLTIGMSVTDACQKAESYRILSFQDAAYAYEKFVRPRRAEARKEPEADAPPGCAFKRFERTLVTLDLPTPLKEGATYYVVAQGEGGTMVTGAHTAASFAYSPGPAAPLGDDAVDLAVLGMRRVEPVGPGLIVIEFGPNFAPRPGSDPANYRITINGQPAKATRLGRITRIDTYLPIGWPFVAIPMHEVFLEVAPAFKDGDRIEIAAGESVTRAAKTASLAYGDLKSLSNSIRVNQVGYLPDEVVRPSGAETSPASERRATSLPVRVAYLGRWMGSFPEKPAAGAPANPSLLFPQEPEFAVCEADSGRRAFASKARLIHTSGTLDEGVYKVDHSGENVYLLDFSAFKAPGRYFISVAQVGRSLPFEIAADVYRKAFEVQAYGVYAQRCGIELGPPWSEWRRMACHKKGLALTTQIRLEQHDIGDLAKRVVPAELIPAYGGHHDAGDYNPRSHLDIAQTLMDAYEIAPRKYSDGQLSIPEKGNGIPDILDEAFWALRLWIGLQDADGGVFNGTESNGDPNFIQTVELDPLGDYAYAKDAAGSFDFAGAAAQASRILSGLGNRAQEAADLLRRARRAYDWAIQHSPQKTAPPAAYLSLKAYAAAELLHTTGEKQFRDDFAAACIWAKKPNADLEVHQQYDQSRAAWAYARCDPKVADPALQRAARDAIVRYVDTFISYNSKMAYAFLRHPWAPISWGTGAQLHHAITATWAYALTGDAKYKAWIIRSCDNTLGANPLNRSYIVGLGTRTVRAPLHNSRYCHLGDVAAGMQVEGPVQSGEGYNIRETAYPRIRPDFACLYTFADCHFAIAMDEGLSRSQAEAMAVFGFLLPDQK